MAEYLVVTEEQNQFAEMASRIIEHELRPYIRKLKHADGRRSHFPMDVFRSLADTGFYRVCQDVAPIWKMGH